MASREQFEEWLYQQRVRGINLNIDKFDVDGEIYYKSPDIQGKWNAWQASREAIEIELKQFDHFQICHYVADERYADGYIDAQNNANKAIEQAGLKVKK